MNAAIDRLLDWVITLLLSITVVSVVGQVIFRYVLHDPLVGSEELAKLSFVWMIFLGAAVVTRDKLHIQVDYFFGKFPKRLAAAIEVGMKFVTILLFSLVAWYGFKYVGVQKGMLSVGLNIPLAFYSFAVPTGSLFILFYTVSEMVGSRNRNSSE